MASILAAGVAPAFVRSGVLMPVKEIWVPEPHKFFAAVMRPNGEVEYVDTASSYKGGLLTIQELGISAGAIIGYMKAPANFDMHCTYAY